MKIKNISKAEAREKIGKFFEKIKDENPEDVGKIKKLSMSQNIPLGEKRKLFCKKCLSPYLNQKTRVKNGMKITKCSKCGNISRWKIKLSS